LGGFVPEGMFGTPVGFVRSPPEDVGNKGASPHRGFDVQCGPVNGFCLQVFWSFSPFLHLILMVRPTNAAFF